MYKEFNNIGYINCDNCNIRLKCPAIPEDETEFDMCTKCKSSIKKVCEYCGSNFKIVNRKMYCCNKNCRNGDSI